MTGARSKITSQVALLGVGLALLLLQLLAFAFHKLTAAGQKRKLCGASANQSINPTHQVQNASEVSA